MTNFFRFLVNDTMRRRARMEPSSFFRRLFFALLLVAIPTAGMLALTLYQAQEFARSQVHSQVRLHSDTGARIVDETLGRAELLLTVLTARTQATSMSPEGCQSLIAGLDVVSPVVVNIIVSRTDGKRVCSLMLAPGVTAPVAEEADWFDAASRGSNFTLSAPRQGKTSKRRIALLSRPIRGADGAKVGVMALSLDLLELSRSLEPRVGATTGLAMTVLGPQGKVYARFPGAEKYINVQVPPDDQAMYTNGEGDIVRRAGLDGIERMYALSKVGRYDLSVRAGIPVEQLYAPVRDAWRKALASLLLVLLVILWVAVYLARYFAKPVRSLLEASRRISLDPQERADEALPGEFGGLAREFNRLLNTLSDRLNQLSDARRETQRKEQQLSGIIATAMDAIITVDARGRIVLFNETASRIFGHEPARVLGEPLDMLMPQRFRRSNGQSIEALASPDASGLQLSGLRADGTEFPAEASISRLGGGEDMLTTIVLRDVTKLREAEALRQAQATQQAAQKARSDFLSKVSHELRTPLNAVLGFTRLVAASSASRLTPKEHTQLATAISAGGQLRELIDDVLDATRLDAGTMKVALQDLELCELLGDIVNQMQVSATDAKIALTCEADLTQKVPLRSDPVRLRQVFTNLLSNAIKYNRPGGQVFVDLSVADAEVQVAVRDTGLGMSEEQLSHLFQPFNRLGREHSSIAGHGIGLSLTRDLVELVGGHLVVTSTLDVGTTFIVSLPAACVAPPMPAAASSGHAKPVQHVDVSLPRQGVVVYVEDQPINALIVEQVLACWPDVQVVVAEDAASGVREIVQRKPDLVLLDMHLPDATGLDVMAQLKKDPTMAGIPVVLLSANAFSEARDEALAAGATDYWTKPFDFDQFVRDVAGYLRPARAVA